MSAFDDAAAPEFMEIPRASGSLAALVHLPSRVPAPTVICCHGLLSSKDSSKFVTICEELCQAGFAAVRFDFSGCGASPKASEPTLLATRSRDLTTVMAHVRRQIWTNGRVGLLGSSLGGFLALQVAAQSTRGVIEAVVCWATPFDLARLRTALEQADRPVGASAARTVLGEPQDLTALPPLSSVLVVHGEQDATVDWREAVQIYRRLADPKQLLLFERADHRFLDPACRHLAIRASVDWFRSHLAG
jgi:uncharacterized protein